LLSRISRSAWSAAFAGDAIKAIAALRAIDAPTDEPIKELTAAVVDVVVKELSNRILFVIACISPRQ
jgi:hypothetical protein